MILNGHNTTTSFRIIILLIISLLLYACAVGPDFHPPPPPKTKRYTRLAMPKKTVSIKTSTNAGKAQSFVMQKKIPKTWWKLFHSHKLNRLIAEGLHNNQSLAKAKATLLEAQKILRAAIGNLLLPSIDLKGSGQRNRVASIQYGVPIPPDVFTLYTLGGELSYILDIWGRQRREVETYRARVDYERYELMAAYLTITSNIATTFINIASLQAQIRQMHALIQAQENILTIVKRQLQLGGASEEDVLTQQTLLAQTKAKLPPLQKSLSQSQHAMAVLLGKPTSQSGPFRLNLDKLRLPPRLPVTLPSQLVQQRPDIQAAQALLHVASAEIGMATTDLLPQFTLSGSYGWVSPILSQLFVPLSRVWEYGFNFIQPLFHGGALFEQREAALAAYQVSLAQYQETVLEAFKDVSDTLRTIQENAKEFKDQIQAETTSKQTLQMIQQQFKLGGRDYLAVLNAEKNYEEISIERIKAQAARFTATAALFQALGGGWWDSSYLHKTSHLLPSPHRSLAPPAYFASKHRHKRQTGIPTPRG